METAHESRVKIKIHKKEPISFFIIFVITILGLIFVGGPLGLLYVTFLNYFDERYGPTVALGMTFVGMVALVIFGVVLGIIILESKYRKRGYDKIDITTLNSSNRLEGKVRIYEIELSLDNRNTVKRVSFGELTKSAITILGSGPYPFKITENSNADDLVPLGNTKLTLEVEVEDGYEIYFLHLINGDSRISRMVSNIYGKAVINKMVTTGAEWREYSNSSKGSSKFKIVFIVYFLIVLLIVLYSVFRGETSKHTIVVTDVSTTLATKAETTSTNEEIDASISKIAKAKPGAIVSYGAYEQDNNTGNGKERLSWRVLAKENGKVLLFSEYIINAKPYNETDTHVTWETCTLRLWLNNDFYNSAFSSYEQSKIETTTVVNADTPNEYNPTEGTEGGNNTRDKLFLLSYDEVRNPAYGFSQYPSDSNKARQAHGSEYAKNNGLYVSDESAYMGESFWWLRSPGDLPWYAGFVGYEGNVYYTKGNVYRTNFGVRPAFWININ